MPLTSSSFKHLFIRCRFPCLPRPIELIILFILSNSDLLGCKQPRIDSFYKFQIFGKKVSGFDSGYLNVLGLSVMKETTFVRGDLLLGR